MVVLICSRCEHTLTIHCGNTSCTWLRCRNTECQADMYDVDAGALLLRSGVVERLGEG